MENPNAPIAPPSETPQPQPEPKTAKPSLLIGLGVLALILLASTGYLAFQNYQLKKEISQLQSSPSPTSTPDPTASWKTYKDNKQGVEFKYPDNWYTALCEPDTFCVFLDDKPIKIPEASEFITPIHVGFNEATNTVTNKKYFEEKTLEEGIERYKAIFDSKTVKVVEDLLVGGKEAAQVSGNSGPGMLEGEYFEYTLIQMDNKLLVIQLFGEKYQNIYNQILSTFKFVEATPSATPTGSPSATLTP